MKFSSILSKIQPKRNLYAFTVGTAAGCAVGLCGWGGAQVIIPSMTLPMSFANYSQLSATGISLSSLSVSTLSSGYRFWEKDRVHLPIVLAIGIPAVFSARVGSHIAKKLSGDALALFFNGFSIVLIPTHFYIQKRAKGRQPEVSSKGQEYDGIDPVCTTATATARSSHPLTWPQVAQHASFGICSGIISALMGVGGLPLTMSYITEATHLPHHYVQGTAVCALIPSILVSAASRIHSIPVQAAVSVALGAMVGGYGGAQVALDLTEEQLRTIYMTSLVVFGGRSTFGAARNIRNIIQANRGR
ncbi:unnamed protein product [Cylindrotheca closterium]|uniref:Membrane transporter protein n=1 Tax=Cylindrotheca closterium TaxID=2856 RepID=A0AAD2FY27_9STRA|nr:unnamed protein product [Cylindrotheca closterium]